MKKILVGAVKASTSKPFWKVALISFVVFFASWIIVFVQSPESAKAFASYTWLAPTILSLAKFVQEYFSALKK
jgi:hypothetical protein